MTIQIDTGQALAMLVSALGAPALTIVVQDWRRRRRESDAKIKADALREQEAQERSEQHTENKERLNAMTGVLEAAFGANGRRGFLVHRQEFELLQSAHTVDHGRLNAALTVVEGHREQIFGLRRDVDELRRAE